MAEHLRVFKREPDGGIVETADQEEGQQLTVLLDPTEWTRYRKKVETAATRITGPFVVETSEGPLTCRDGYLAVDARGYPYPIATDEFELIYEPVA